MGVAAKESLKKYVAAFKKIADNEVGAIGNIEKLAENAARIAKGEFKIVETSINEAHKDSTKVGHAFSKHAGKKPGVWVKVRGDKSTWHEQGLRHYEEIINGPGKIELITTTKTAPSGRIIESTFFEKRLPDGRGVRFRLDGNFETFIE